MHVGGGYDPHVHCHGLGRAQAADRALLQGAQQFGLRAGGQVGHLVEEQGAAMGRFEFAGGLVGGAGERALLVAEQLVFEQRFRDCTAIHRD